MILRKCSRSSRSSSSTLAVVVAAANALGSGGCRLRRSSLGEAAWSPSGSPPPPSALSPGHGSCSRCSSRPRRSALRIALAGGSLSSGGGGGSGCALRDTAHVADIPATAAGPGRAGSRPHFRRCPGKQAVSREDGRRPRQRVTRPGAGQPRRRGRSAAPYFRLAVAGRKRDVAVQRRLGRPQGGGASESPPEPPWGGERLPRSSGARARTGQGGRSPPAPARRGRTPARTSRPAQVRRGAASREQRGGSRKGGSAVALCHTESGYASRKQAPGPAMGQEKQEGKLSSV